MGKIHILDEATINKIAAGEVIERPASAVKELIENSIDAGATDIKVEVSGGGKKLIRVMDNGSGMGSDDAKVSYLKHATSKISAITDIDDVSTMGFRGEALSSITAVAKVEITTRTERELSGRKITVHGGKTISSNETGCAVGTSVTVEDLFYNTPARKKYLKSDTTELAHIIDVVTRNAIGHNNISFTLLHNGKQLLRSPAAPGLLDTIIHIYGKDTAKSMLAVNLESGYAKISGFVSKPALTRSSIDSQSFFINNRSVTSRAISNGLRKGYGTLIPKGRFPIAVLKISVNRKEVDVNVHPTKNEVRLSHERELSDAVTDAVKNAMAGRNLVPDIKLLQTQQALLYESPVSENIIREPAPESRVSVKDTQRRLRHTERMLAGQINRETELPKIRILGQVDNLYVIAEKDDGIVIIDQHAAHERVLFEQVRESKRNDSQELIVPVNLKLDSKERVLMKETIPYLEEFGFRISVFGPGSFAVTAVPDILGRLEDTKLIHDIITDILSEGRIKDETGIFERLTKSIACRGAIKSGAGCSQDQMESLIRQLFRSGNPYTCPHGRPTMVSFNRQELDKLFRRT
ncbi:MAG: DNA mismatch repair endonuclease MutL [Candidatus Methanoperedens sp.]|jgi:DNA mismatch repair protein MutL|nr:DNA mismatch repair endonuclease MutL [Candidatus Methanoperedens sp.]PKL53910.1 MAG: DNA mismatch repair protein MutL [Candidatus Methanoperedenaceae archaeon HGW-Methanoperedenaceae-1]